MSQHLIGMGVFLCVRHIRKLAADTIRILKRAGGEAYFRTRLHACILKKSVSKAAGFSQSKTIIFEGANARNGG